MCCQLYRNGRAVFFGQERESAPAEGINQLGQRFNPPVNTASTIFRHV